MLTFADVILKFLELFSGRANLVAERFSLTNRRTRRRAARELIRLGAAPAGFKILPKLKPYHKPVSIFQRKMDDFKETASDLYEKTISSIRGPRKSPKAPKNPKKKSALKKLISKLKKQKARKAEKEWMGLEQLEERILLSASPNDPNSGLVDSALIVNYENSDVDIIDEDSDYSTLDAVDVLDISSNGTVIVPGLSIEGNMELVLSGEMAHDVYDTQPVIRNIVIVDSAVDGYQDILDDLALSNVMVFVLDADQDGISQISSILADFSNLDSLHILSHGSEGELALGNSVLNSENLSDVDLSAWATALGEGADLLLYGCNVAGNETGVGFVEDLSELIGADVAASDDLTGAVQLGGDWELEYASGAIEANGIVSDYNGTLEIITSTGADEALAPASAGTDDSFVFSDGWGVDTVTTDGGTDSLDFSAVTGDLSIEVTASDISITEGANTVNNITDAIDSVISGTGSDTLNITGAVGDNTITIAGDGSTLTYNGTTFILADIETITFTGVAGSNLQLSGGTALSLTSTSATLNGVTVGFSSVTQIKTDASTVLSLSGLAVGSNTFAFSGDVLTAAGVTVDLSAVTSSSIVGNVGASTLAVTGATSLDYLSSTSVEVNGNTVNVDANASLGTVTTAAAAFTLKNESNDDTVAVAATSLTMTSSTDYAALAIDTTTATSVIYDGGTTAAVTLSGATALGISGAAATINSGTVSLNNITTLKAVSGTTLTISGADDTLTVADNGATATLTGGPTIDMANVDSVLFDDGGDTTGDILVLTGAVGDNTLTIAGDGSTLTYNGEVFTLLEIENISFAGVAGSNLQLSGGTALSLTSTSATLNGVTVSFSSVTQIKTVGSTVLSLSGLAAGSNTFAFSGDVLTAAGVTVDLSNVTSSSIVGNVGVSTLAVTGATSLDYLSSTSVEVNGNILNLDANASLGTVTTAAAAFTLKNESNDDTVAVAATSVTMTSSSDFGSLAIDTTTATSVIYDGGTTAAVTLSGATALGLSSSAATINSGTVSLNNITTLKAVSGTTLTISGVNDTLTVAAAGATATLTGGPTIVMANVDTVVFDDGGDTTGDSIVLNALTGLNTMNVTAGTLTFNGTDYTVAELENITFTGVAGTELLLTGSTTLDLVGTTGIDMNGVSISYTSVELIQTTGITTINIDGESAATATLTHTSATELNYEGQRIERTVALTNLTLKDVTSFINKGNAGDETFTVNTAVDQVVYDGVTLALTNVTNLEIDGVSGTDIINYDANNTLVAVTETPPGTGNINNGAAIPTTLLTYKNIDSVEITNDDALFINQANTVTVFEKMLPFLNAFASENIIPLTNKSFGEVLNFTEIFKQLNASIEVDADYTVGELKTLFTTALKTAVEAALSGSVLTVTLTDVDSRFENGVKIIEFDVKLVLVDTVSHNLIVASDDTPLSGFQDGAQYYAEQNVNFYNNVPTKILAPALDTEPPATQLGTFTLISTFTLDMVMDVGDTVTVDINELSGKVTDANAAFATASAVTLGTNAGVMLGLLETDITAATVNLDASFSSTFASVLTLANFNSFETGVQGDDLDTVEGKADRNQIDFDALETGRTETGKYKSIVSVTPKAIIDTGEPTVNNLPTGTITFGDPDENMNVFFYEDGILPVFVSDDLNGFRNITAERLVDDMYQIALWLQQLNQSLEYGEAIPFTDGVNLGELANHAMLLENKILTKLVTISGSTITYNFNTLRDLMEITYDSGNGLSVTYNSTSHEFDYELTLADNFKNYLTFNENQIIENYKVGDPLESVVYAETIPVKSFPVDSYLVSAQADFIIEYDGVTLPTATLILSDTYNNTTMADLVADINLAFTAAGINTSVTAGDDGGGKLTITGADLSKSLELTFIHKTAELGFTNASAAVAGILTAATVPIPTTPYIIDNVIADFNYVLSAKADFVIKYDGAQLNIATLSFADTYDNTSMADLVADINAAFSAAGIDGFVIAGVDGGGKLTITGADSSKSLELIFDKDTDLLGFNLGQQTSGFLSAASSPTSPTDPAKPWILSDLTETQADFIIKYDGITLSTATLLFSATSDNTSMADLAADITAAFTTAGINTSITVAVDAAGKLVIKGVDKSKSLELTFTEDTDLLGFVNGTSNAAGTAGVLTAVSKPGAIADFRIKYDGNYLSTASLDLADHYANSTAADWATDLNTAFTAAGIDSYVTAGVSAGKLTITAADTNKDLELHFSEHSYIMGFIAGTTSVAGVLTAAETPTAISPEKVDYLTVDFKIEYNGAMLPTAMFKLSDTHGNTGMADLLADINAAFVVAGIETKVIAVERDGKVALKGANDTDEIRLTYSGKTGLVGFLFGAESSIEYTSPEGGDIEKITVKKSSVEAVESPFGVTTAFDFSSNAGIIMLDFKVDDVDQVALFDMATTVGNTTITNLVTDLNAVLTAIGVTAGESAGKLTFKATSATETLSFNFSDLDVSMLGLLSSTDYSAVAGATVTAENTPSGNGATVFELLPTIVLNFEINGLAVTPVSFKFSDTSGNTTIDHLITDITTALTTAGIETIIVVGKTADGERLKFSTLVAGDTLKLNFGNAEAALLGFINGADSLISLITVNTDISADIDFGYDIDTIGMSPLTAGGAGIVENLTEMTAATPISAFDFASDPNFSFSLWIDGVATVVTITAGDYADQAGMLAALEAAMVTAGLNTRLEAQATIINQEDPKVVITAVGDVSLGYTIGDVVDEDVFDQANTDLAGGLTPATGTDTMYYDSGVFFYFIVTDTSINRLFITASDETRLDSILGFENGQGKQKDVIDNASIRDTSSLDTIFESVWEESDVVIDFGFTEYSSTNAAAQSYTHLTHDFTKDVAIVNMTTFGASGISGSQEALTDFLDSDSIGDIATNKTLTSPASLSTPDADDQFLFSFTGTLLGDEANATDSTLVYTAERADLFSVAPLEVASAANGNTTEALDLISADDIVTALEEVNRLLKQTNGDVLFGTNIPGIGLNATTINTYLKQFSNMVSKVSKENFENYQELIQYINEAIGQTGFAAGQGITLPGISFDFNQDIVTLNFYMEVDDSVDFDLFLNAYELALLDTTDIATNIPNLNNEFITIMGVNAQDKMSATSTAILNLDIEFDYSGAELVKTLKNTSSMDVDFKIDETINTAVLVGADTYYIIGGKIVVEDGGGDASYSLSFTGTDGTPGDLGLIFNSDTNLDLVADIDTSLVGEAEIDLPFYNSNSTNDPMTIEDGAPDVASSLNFTMSNLANALTGTADSVVVANWATVPNFKDRTSSAFGRIMADPQLLINGLDQILENLIFAIETPFLALENIPLVGDEIMKGIDPLIEMINDLRNNLISYLNNQYQAELAKTDAPNAMIIMRNILYDIFHTKLGIMENYDSKNVDGVILPASAFTETDIETTVMNGTSGVAVTAATATELLNATGVEYNFHLGDLYTVSLPFEFGFGTDDFALDEILPNFGFNVDAGTGVTFALEWDLYLGFGLSDTELFYLIADQTEDYDSDGDGIDDVDTNDNGKLESVIGEGYTDDVAEFTITAGVYLSDPDTIETDPFTADMSLGFLGADFTDGFNPSIILEADTGLTIGDIKYDWAGSSKTISITTSGGTEVYDLKGATIADMLIALNAETLINQGIVLIPDFASATADLDGESIAQMLQDFFLSTEGGTTDTGLKLQVMALTNDITNITVNSAELGFTAGQSQDLSDMDKEATKLEVSFVADIVEPDSGDGNGHISFSEFSGDMFEVELTATAQAAMQVHADSDYIATAFSSVTDSLGFSNLSLPEFDFGLKATFEASVGTSTNWEPEYGMEGIEFHNFTVDAEFIIKNILKPLVDGVSDIISPLRSFLGDGLDGAAGLLNQPIPGLSELKEYIDAIPSTLLEMTGAADEINALLGSIKRTFALLDALKSFSNTLDDGTLNLGTWIYVTDPESPFAIGYPVPKMIVDIYNNVMEAAENAEDIEAPQDLGGLSSILGMVGVGSDLTETLAVEPGGFRLDLLKPANLFKVILGEPFDIVSYNLPGVNITNGIDYGFGFSAGGNGLGFNIKGSTTINIFQMGIVYDSTGLQHIMDSINNGLDPDFSDLLDGFYIRTVDGDEISFSMNFSGGASIDLTTPSFKIPYPYFWGIDWATIPAFVIFKVSASVSANAYLGLDLQDPNGDNKLRLDEIMMLTDNLGSPQNALCMFQVSVSADAAMSMYAEVANITLLNLSLAVDIGTTFSIAEIFGIDCDSVEANAAVLAEKQGTTLRINGGEFAYARIFGDEDDSDGNNMRIVADASNITVYRGSASKTYSTAGITKIVYRGSEGADVIDFSGFNNTNILLDLDGGAGNDIIKGGISKDGSILSGGLGNDIITGGSAAEYIFGDEGDDTILGGAGADIIVGGVGTDTIDGQGGDDIYLYGSTRDERYGWGSDTVTDSGASTGDKLDMTAIRSSDSLLFSLTSTGGLVTAGDAGSTAKRVTITGTGIDHYLGGKGSDIFNIVSNGANNWTLDGDEGADTYVVSSSLTGNLTIADTGKTLTNDGATDRFIIEGTTGNDTIAFDKDSVILSPTTTLIINASLEKIVFNLKAGNDTVTVKSTRSTTSLIVNGGDGDDELKLGYDTDGTALNLNDILAVSNIGKIEFNAGFGYDTLTLNDSSDSSSNTGDDKLVVGNGIFTGLGMDEGVKATDLDKFIVNLGSASDEVDVTNILAEPDKSNNNVYLEIYDAEIYGNDGADDINIIEFHGDLKIHTGAGADTINVKNYKGLTAIDSGSGNDIIDLEVIHQATSPFVPLSNVIDPNDAAYAAADKGKTGITGIGNGIDGGTGNDLIYLRTSTGQVDIDGQDGSDNVYIGSLAPEYAVDQPESGTLNGIKGDVNVSDSGSTGSDILHINDSADGTDNTGTLTSTTFSGLGMSDAGVTGPDNNNGIITYANQETLNLYLGQGNDTLNITSTHLSTTNIVANGGSDIIYATLLSATVNITGDFETNVLAATRDVNEGDDHIFVDTIAAGSQINIAT
ncbi:MAG: DUF4347 domain-containing protein, partial [Lentisphaeria bacterium]|nr:DUF4347 domain-containing protein [Lentisphaeria bacterium]